METKAEVVDLVAFDGTLGAVPAAPIEALPVELPRERQRRRANVWALSCATTDLAMLLTSWVAATAAETALGGARTPFVWACVLDAIALALLARNGLYAYTSSIRTLDAAAAIGRSMAYAMVALLALDGVVDGPLSAGHILTLATATGAVLIFGRLSFYRAQLRGRRVGEGLRRTMILGAGVVGHLVAKRLLERPELGLLPVAYVDDDPMPRDRTGDLAVLASTAEIDALVHEQDIEHAIFAFSAQPDPHLAKVLKRCEELGVTVSVIPRMYERTPSRLEIDHIGGLPLFHIRYADSRSWGFAIKHAIDRVVAAVVLVLMAPVMAVAAIAVYRSLGAPVLFRQRRVGRDGRVFTMMKFRSMRAGDASIPEAERLTRTGALLRRTSLDELPQLINVLRGEMSLIGPRPERPELVEAFERSIHRYDERHRVKSGITGWAQVHGIGRGSERFGDTSLSERVEWDNFYIENWSLWLDAKIVLMTMLAVLRFRQDT